MQIVAQKYGVEPLIKLSHTVKGAAYDDATGEWTLQVQDAEGVVRSEVVSVYIPATGVLSYAFLSLLLRTLR